MVGHEKTSRTNGINLSNLHEPVLHFPFVYQQPTHHCNENLPNFGSKSAFMRLSPLDQITGAALVIGVASKQRSPSRRPRNAEISLHRVVRSRARSSAQLRRRRHPQILSCDDHSGASLVCQEYGEHDDDDLATATQQPTRHATPNGPLAT